MKTFLIACSTAGALLMGAAEGTAQAAAPEAPRRECFRGRPAAFCRTFWITETGYQIRLRSVERYEEFNPGGWLLPTADLGGMVNVGPQTAVGGTVGIGVLGSFYTAVKPRVRQWVTPRVSLDLAPSLLIHKDPGVSRLAGEVSVMLDDKIGVSAQAFRVTTYRYPIDAPPEPRRRLTMYLGLKLGSKLGVGGALADAAGLLAAIGLYAIACANGGCD